MAAFIGCGWTDRAKQYGNAESCGGEMLEHRRSPLASMAFPAKTAGRGAPHM
jgi:hypothetical protein